MVNTLSTDGKNISDVEECLSDVIYKEFDNYWKLHSGKEKDLKIIERRVCSWIKRRAKWDLESITKMMARRNRLSNETRICTEIAQVGEYVYEHAVLDNPEQIVELFQLVNDVPDILIDYESFRGGKRTRGDNGSKLPLLHFRAKKKFMMQLAA